MIAHSSAVDLLIGLGLPVLFLIFWGRRTLHRQRTAEQSAEPLVPAAPELEPNAFLCRFSAPERVYLRTQLKFVPYGFLLLTWLFLFEMTLPIFNTFPHAELWSDATSMHWYNFVEILRNVPQMESVMVFGTACLAIMPLRLGGPGLFYRTRPLPVSFLFWSRVLPAVTVFALSFITASLAAVGLFIFLHGHAWQHLPAVIPRKLGPDDSDIADIYAALRISSVPRMFLSLLVDGCLLCSVGIAVASIQFGGPSRQPIPRGPLVAMAILIMGAPIANLLVAFGVLNVSPWLFLYNTPGPPPPLAFALVPLALATALILVASRLIRRVEL